MNCFLIQSNVQMNGSSQATQNIHRLIPKQLIIQEIHQLVRTQSLETSKLSTQCSKQPKYGLKDVETTPTPPTNNAMFHPSRYKIEMCYHYNELGKCQFGDRCLYAHSKSELRPCTYRHKKFKTELCKNFHSEGYCDFGARCSFIHSKPDLDSLINYLENHSVAKLPMPENPSPNSKSSSNPSPNPDSDDMSSIETDCQKIVSVLKGWAHNCDDESDLLPSSFNGNQDNRLKAFVRLSNH